MIFISSFATVARSSFNSINIVMIPDATETIDADFDITATAVGQDKDDTTASNAGQTKSVTIDLLTEWDITSLLPTIAAGDQLSFTISSNTSTEAFLGIRFIYQRGT